MIKILRNIVSLAWLVILDGLRRHALLGLLLLAIAAETGALLFFDFIPRDIGRASNDFLFSIGWFTGFVFLLFHAVQAIAWDEERRIIHTILARPISRSQYVVGVFFGLAILLLQLNVLLASLGWGIESMVKSSVKTYYFPHLFLSYYILSWIGLYAVELMLLAVILLFSGLIRGSFTVLLLSLSYYFICSGLPVVREFISSKPSPEGSMNLEGLLKWMSAVFPDFSRFDFKALAISERARPLVEYLLTDFLQMGLYVALVLFFACLVYRQRDLK